MQIQETSTAHRFALHHLGFRPFFLLAGWFSVVTMALWLWLYHIDPTVLPLHDMTSITWHAHEMIYGYAMAVIAGFLLTAVRNWTNVDTLRGAWLLLLALLWLLARIAPFIDQPYAIKAMIILDLGFNLGLCAAVLHPIVKVRQWEQLAVWTKLTLLLLGNLLFYLGVLGIFADGLRWGLYTGLYIVLSLVLMMARRVIPFFIEKGVGYTVTLTNRRWVDIGSLILMLIFLVVEVYIPMPLVSACTALLLFLLHALRMAGWYTPGIWSKPLLWVLYLAYGWIVLGFAFKGLSYFMSINPMLAVHAFAYGGIGMMTIGMMARVALGHTGRNVFAPPAILLWVFLVFFIGSVTRVLLPLIAPAWYTLWIGVSQVSWIMAFALFSFIYTPMLIKPRIDGCYG